MVRARRPVRRRGALVEDPLLRALAAAQRLREHNAIAPALPRLALERGQLLARVDLAWRYERVGWTRAHGRLILGGRSSRPWALRLDAVSAREMKQLRVLTMG